MQRIVIVGLAWLCLAISANGQLPSLAGFETDFHRGASSAHGAPSHTQERLLLSVDTAKAGDTVWAGLEFKMDAGWHTYWKNPGDFGGAIKVEWSLPPGVTAGGIQWPLPKKVWHAGLTNYVYEDNVVLLVPLTVAGNLPPGLDRQPNPLNLAAKVSWVECDVAGCISASITNQATLAVGAETKLSANIATIESWRNKLPKTNSLPFQAWWDGPANGNVRPLVIGIEPSAAAKNISYDTVDFYPDPTGPFEITAATEVLDARSAGIRLRKFVKKYEGDWPQEISGVLVVQEGNNHYGSDLKVTVDDKTPAWAPATTAPMPSGTKLSLWQTLLYAFIGGLILNIMPCVLPVIALKILGFVGEARNEPRRVRNLGLVYAVGVLVSFLALAGFVISVKAAGHRAGWGMQFSNPIFLVCMTTLITLVALNLFGVFEVTPGGRVMNAAGQLASKHGAPGAFFNGFLATALATPCTAPFLAPALGFAFAQSAAVIVLVFLAAGLGLAAPYVLLCFNPRGLKFLPKPGAWMEKFKVAMGFPMLATAVWLFNIAGSSYGKDVFWLGAFLVIVAAAAWIFGTFVQRGRRKGPALAIVLLLLLGGYAFALEKELHWRTPAPPTDSPASSTWQPWSPEAVAKARAEGRPVLVDFTADWCLTCQVNKKVAIDVASVQAKLKAVNAVTLVADYTHTPENISAELDRYDRAGVPLVLVFPKDPAAPAIVLPSVLTPGTVLDALDKAAH